MIVLKNSNKKNSNKTKVDKQLVIFNKQQKLVLQLWFNNWEVRKWVDFSLSQLLDLVIQRVELGWVCRKACCCQKLWDKLNLQLKNWNWKLWINKLKMYAQIVGKKKGNMFVVKLKLLLVVFCVISNWIEIIVTFLKLRFNYNFLSSSFLIIIFLN